jgi:predicted HicB family RNase H-like nuclease
MSRTEVTPSPGGRRSEQRQRTALVALRFLPEEHQQLVDAARARGISLSELIRDSALNAISEEHRGPRTA